MAQKLCKISSRREKFVLLEITMPVISLCLNISYYLYVGNQEHYSEHIYLYTIRLSIDDFNFRIHSIR